MTKFPIMIGTSVMKESKRKFEVNLDFTNLKIKIAEFDI